MSLVVNQSKARKAAGLGRDISPLFGIQCLACGHHLERLGVSMYSSQMPL